MKKEQVTYPSSNGEDTISAIVWSDEKKKVRGVVQIVHGMCEYIDRYEDLARFLVSNGFVVCGEDHLGHGDSVGEKGYGYFAKRQGWNYIVKDIHAFSKHMKERYPDAPYFILGHSMGSLLARVLMLRHGDELDGVILSGTAGPTWLAWPGLWLAKLIRLFKGEMYHSPLLYRMIFGKYNDKITPRRTDFDWLSRDNEVVDRYIADPKCNFTFTVSAYAELISLMGFLSNAVSTDMAPKNLPLYIYSGNMDPVGNYGKGISKLYHRLHRAGVRDITLKLYDGGRHEMHNEINRQEVYNDILEWLQAHN